MTRLLTSLFLAALFFYYLPRFCYEKTDGFQLHRIYAKHPPSVELNTPSLDTIKPFCSSGFHYMGYGGQCWVFASEDGQTVLKLFKTHQREVHPLIQALPLWGKLADKRQIHAKKRAKKFIRDFNSYALAFTDLKEETGLIYAHLKKEGAPLFVTIIDKLGVHHKIDLSKTEFLLQKKATLALDYIQEAMDEGDHLKASSALHQICDIIVQRSNKGIYDEDAKIHRNFGFVEGKAIILDVGRFRYEKGLSNKEIVIKATKRLHGWLEEHYPTLTPALEEKWESI